MLLNGGDCCSGILTNVVIPVLLGDRMGFANSTESIAYASGGGYVPVKRTSGSNLRVTLTGFTPGNALLIGYSFAPVDGVVSGVGGIRYDVIATLDINGGGQKQIKSYAVGIDMRSNNPENILLAMATQWTTFYMPAAVDVTQTPVIGLDARSAGDDDMIVPAGSALLWVAEIDAATITQVPTTTLQP